MTILTQPQTTREKRAQAIPEMQKILERLRLQWKQNHRMQKVIKDPTLINGEESAMGLAREESS